VSFTGACEKFSDRKFCVTVLDQLVETAQQSRFFCYRAKHECPTDDILFFFYTRATQFDPIVLNMKEPDEIMKAPFDFSRPLTVILHGYTGWKDYSPNTELRPAFFESGEQNIISVDYNPLVLEPCYYTATQNLQVVANCTAQILDFMVAKGLFKLENIHIIGFSLGAQAAGMVANYFKSGQLDHITGLDPGECQKVKSNP
jgi:pancreatic triacylglycerol lipase